MPALRSKQKLGVQRRRSDGLPLRTSPKTVRKTRESIPRVNAVRRGTKTRSKLEATLPQKRGSESPVLRTRKSGEGCKTDPEPDMDSGRAGVRNMRSKCRCSYVLQFTFRRAVCCVLHRPPSQVIHCAVLSLLTKSIVATRDELANN